MLLKVDAAQLEWRVKVFLSQDKLALREINDGFDLHTDNQQRFELPSRTIAKNWLYRMIFADAFGPNEFRGPAYAYANDADFMHVSTSVGWWEKRVRTFFTEKYTGIYEHGLASIRTAIDCGRITVPSGRFYLFKPYIWNGQMDWPRTHILNYPVQGFSADLMMVARLLIKERLFKLGLGKRALLINTVHDDVELDVDNDPELVYTICMLLEKCFQDIPQEFERRFGVVVNVPMSGEVKMGWTLYEEDMVKFKQQTFQEDWRQLYGKSVSN